MERWSSEWMQKTESRLQRAIYRALINCDKSEIEKRVVRICLHAEKLGWLAMPTSAQLGIKTERPRGRDAPIIHIEIKKLRRHAP